MSELHSSYPVAVRWTGGKQGVGSSPDGLPNLDIASPPAFGGPGGVWSPEHLFALAATACWMTTFVAIAEASKLEVAALEASATAELEKRSEDRRFWIPRLVLRPRITVARAEDRDRALRIAEKAEAACLVAASMKTAVTMEAEVIEPAAVGAPG
jgi:peroxiredoxin-like protein